MIGESTLPSGVLISTEVLVLEESLGYLCMKIGLEERKERSLSGEFTTVSCDYPPFFHLTPFCSFLTLFFLLLLFPIQACWLVGTQQSHSIRHARHLRSNSRSCRIPTFQPFHSGHASLKRLARNSLSSQNLNIFPNLKADRWKCRMRNHRTSLEIQILQVNKLSRISTSIARFPTFRSWSLSSHSFRYHSKRFSAIDQNSKRQVKQSAPRTNQSFCSSWKWRQGSTSNGFYYSSG